MHRLLIFFSTFFFQYRYDEYYDADKPNDNAVKAPEVLEFGLDLGPGVCVYVSVWGEGGDIRGFCVCVCVCVCVCERERERERERVCVYTHTHTHGRRRSRAHLGLP